MSKVLLVACCTISSTPGLTLQELESAPNLAPQNFARFFSHFEFRYHDEIRSSDAFLTSQSGDCDDYAILAARILKKRGYTPRLIAVRMPNLVHVVCYIDETRSYLDYNKRSDVSPTVSSGSEIAEI